jgi:hypothetical protein
MAQLVLSQVGAAIGARVLPQGLSVLGARLSGAAIGRTLGSLAGSALGNRYLTPPIEGPRIRDFHVMESREGAPVPIVYGRMRVGGQVIWAADFKESRTTRSGGKGGPRLREYSYSVSFAVGLCEGEISRISRCWANGSPLDLSKVTWRLYPGSETQAVDPLIEAIEGAGAAPAYRGLAYVVFEDLPVDAFGARLPQMSFEVVRPMSGGEGRLESVARGVNLIPGAGEFALATDVVRRVTGPGEEQAENLHGPEAVADFLASLDQLEADLPNARRVNLVVSWFGDDLRCGACRIRPGVDRADKATSPWSWEVAGRTRGTARLVSQQGGRAAYGGTPSDRSVVQAIRALKARGFHVTLYPFVLMDIPAGNGLPDPHGGAEQAAFPWRGRIACHPAPGRPGSPDGSATAAAQVSAFFGGAEGYRAFVLHCADVALEAGGVDGFLIGTELVGLTRVRGAAGDYPAVAALKSLAGEVRARLGQGPELSYAADWTEYGAHVLANGDVRFPLDDLWADPAISHVALDWYPPMSDWRAGESHLDASAGGPHEREYLLAGVAGGEAFDWYYADTAGRNTQFRLPITDGAHGEAWVFRQKDIRTWWGTSHHPRTGGVRAAQPTAWTPGMKPLRFAEFGCPAVDKGANQPNVFHDPKSAESALPHFSSGERDDLVQRRAIEAFCAFWAETANNPASSVYPGRMVPDDGICLWAWDARPFPAFPARGDVWGDGDNWRLGHWLNGRVGAALMSDVVADICARGDAPCDATGVSGLLPGYRVDGPLPVRAALEPLLAGTGVATTERPGEIVFRDPGRFTRAIDPVQCVSVEGSASVEPSRAGMEASGVSLRLSYIDCELDHAPGLVAIEGPPGSVWTDVALPLALNRDAARARASDMLAEIVSGRDAVRIVLPLDALDLEPGDHVLLAGDRLRLTSVVQGEAIGVEARRASAGAGPILALPAPEGAPTATLQAAPDVVILDPPALPGEESDTRPLAFAFSHPWTGPVHLSAGSGADSLTQRGQVDRPCRIGRLVGALYPHVAGRWLDADIWVRMARRDLASATDAQVLGGANAALVETSAGWELVQFASAQQIDPDTWKLSRLLRGQQGTEAQMMAGAAAGSRIVFLDGGQVRLGLADWEWGLALAWRAWRTDPAEPESVPVSFTGLGRARQPWSPVHLCTRRTPAGLELTWIRRARSGGDAWLSGEPPLDMPDSWRIEVRSGGILKRSWTSSGALFLYPQADLQADFPAGGAADIGIAQLGPDGVPGPGLRRTVAIP